MQIPCEASLGLLLAGGREHNDSVTVLPKSSIFVLIVYILADEMVKG